MDENSVLIELCRKEEANGLYEPAIEDISIYSLIRHRVRYKYLEKMGLPAMNLQSKADWLSVIKHAVLSLFQLCRLWIARKTYSTVFYAFPRVDKIGEVYLDKFTDPLIDLCDFKQDYIILDHGRGGVHPKPRAHSGKIVYTDIQEVYSVLYAACLYKRFYNKHKEAFDRLHASITESIGVSYEKNELVKHFLSAYTYSNSLKGLFRHLSSKRVLGPARALMYTPFYAAHQLGMRTFELQHGVTYGESVLYSGFRDPMIMPEVFLSFGDNHPSDVYGIEESRMVNVGWALDSYLKGIPQKEAFQPQDVLVISDPEITDRLLAAVIKLAESAPESTFYIRTHPHEVLNEGQLAQIDAKDNIRIQDKSINISVVLQGFRQVIGADSTVLYEALAVHKKVGKLFMEGLEPHYLEEADRECFWEIHDQTEFEEFIRGDVTDKKSKCIYSQFDKDLFCRTIGLDT